MADSRQQLPEVYLENIRLNEEIKIRTGNQNAAEDFEEIDVKNGTNVTTQTQSNRKKDHKVKATMTDSRQQLPEVYLENIRLNEKIKIRTGNPNAAEDFEEFNVKYGTNVTTQTQPKRKKNITRKCTFCTWKFGMVTTLFILLFGSNAYLLHKSISSSDAKTESMPELQRLIDSPQTSGLMQILLGGNPKTNSIHNINVGMRNDFRLQDCQGSYFKQTFPDVDYAFFGYNILKGYPLAVGHDPGFTFPIFEADYSEGRQTADCRYSIPRGLVIVPDVSCVTSFSSKTIQTKYEFSKSLSVSANVQGGGWGVSFSASAGYKESSSEIATGESVFILSTAKCIYYFSKLVTNSAPRFSDAFLKWINRLNNAETKDVYLDFFDTYGTHFLSHVTFGSRFTYEHKMSSKKYQSERSTGVNVAVQASYSGFFSAGGGFAMDSSQKQSASDFSKNVETKTITIGAPPPANGDAMTWASTVKESPVPMEYKLISIDILFSEKYMGNLNVNYTKISTNINRFKFEYCKYLKDNGQLDSCESLTPGIILTKTRLFDHYKSKALSFGECIDFCLQDIYCEAITYCKTCTEDDQTCYMYANKYYNYKSADLTDSGDEWQSIVFVTKIATYLRFTETNIIGFERGSKNTESCVNNTEECKSICIKDAHCVAFTYSTCVGKIKNCHLYSKNRIKSLKKESGFTTYFMFNRELTENKPTTTIAPDTTTY